MKQNEIPEVISGIMQDISNDLRDVYIESEGSACPSCTGKQFLEGNQTAILATLNELGKVNPEYVLHGISSITWQSIAMQTIMTSLMEQTELLLEDDTELVPFD